MEFITNNIYANKKASPNNNFLYILKSLHSTVFGDCKFFASSDCEIEFKQKVST